MTSPPGPLDPFADDPDDPSRALAELDDDGQGTPPLSPADREGVLDDLAELEVFEALLAPRGVRGLVVDCPDCVQPHHLGWDLLRGNLRVLLDSGTGRVHEPAVAPDVTAYVTWDYACGYRDACLADDRP